ncbi:MAG TPA: CHASE3 domain-containing protein, partial [Acidobacteriaceae bacterium]
MKSTRLERIVFGLLVAAVLVVAANAWLAFRDEQVLAESEAWVAHTWQVIAGLEHAFALVKDAESGVRGYLGTGDARYMAGQQAASQELTGVLAGLRTLVADNPPQLTRMVEMTSLCGQQRALLDDMVRVRNQEGPEAAYRALTDGAGQAEMDRLRSVLTQMEAEERRLLGERMEISARARTEARLTVAFASTLDMLFIMVTLYSLGYERRLRRRESETAQRLAKLQAISDVGLTRLNLDALTTEILERLRRVAEIDGVALLQWQAREIEVTAASGIALAPGTRMRLDVDSPLAESGTDKIPVTLNEAEVFRLRVPALQQEMRSILILPLPVSLGTTAVLVAGRRRPYAFTGQDEQLLSVVADRIALAIDRASLFESEHAARRAAEASAAEVRLLNRELEERVRHRTAELEATNLELEAFSYSVSHDLRAPLRSVDGFSVALEEDYGELLKEEGKHYLHRIRAGVQRMGQLSDALLQLSRITRADLVLERVDLSALALEVAGELEQQDPDRKIEFVVAPGLAAKGDPRLLRAVFENMLGNAVKFTARVEQARIEFGYSGERGA